MVVSGSVKSGMMTGGYYIEFEIEENLAHDVACHGEWSSVRLK